MDDFQAFPIRLALHTDFPGRKDHIDCFIDTNEGEGLISYQTESLPSGLSELGFVGSALHFGLAQREEEMESLFPQGLIRVPSHRPVYMDFSGDLEKNRGHLRELCRGRLWVPKGCIWPNRILLKLLRAPLIIVLLGGVFILEGALWALS